MKKRTTHLLQFLASLFVIFMMVGNAIVAKNNINRIVDIVGCVAWVLVAVQSMYYFIKEKPNNILVYDWSELTLPDHLKTTPDAIHTICQSLKDLPLIESVFVEDMKLIIILKREVSPNRVLDIGFIIGSIDSQERTKRLMAKWENDKNTLYNAGKN